MLETLNKQRKTLQAKNHKASLYKFFSETVIFRRHQFETNHITPYGQN